MMKKKIAVFLAILLMILLVAGCMKGSQTEPDKETEKLDLSNQSFTIAIDSFAEHPAFIKCKDAFVKELQEAGAVEGENLTIAYQSAGGEMERAKLIATSFASTNPDLIYCIGSTSTSVMLSAVHGQKIPIVFAAVTDPISAELSDKDGVQTDEITGVCDGIEPEKQLRMVKQILPDAKIIGIIYSNEETNSVATIERYRALADDYDLEIILKPVRSTHEITLSLDEMANQVDCIVNIQDNFVSSQLGIIVDKALSNKIPVFGCDESQAQNGCIAAQGISYEMVGKEAGKFAIQILEGKRKASEIPFAYYDSSKLYLNLETAAQLEIDIPDSVIEEAEDTFDEIGGEK